MGGIGAAYAAAAALLTPSMAAEAEPPVVVASSGGPSAATAVVSVSLLPELVQARDAASAAALASGADPETAVAMGLEVRRGVSGIGFGRDTLIQSNLCPRLTSGLT